MIITCPNCEKKFNIDTSLVPVDGRDLQCGSCEHVWFYKPELESEVPLTLNENASVDKVEPDIQIKAKNEEFSEKLNQEKITKPEIKETDKTVKKSVNKGLKFFRYLIVFIISFVALVILLDTLKTPLIDIFPGLELVLFNLFETLKDIKLFIIDLS